ncbi:hypothetical protein GCM10022288_26450 [Gryllotalpicola kribbensis]|uniref:Uncharacterized protein n=1 Tax=Gryllotalpicola kribbensis TaxID=993084 RepID=A0ABP8AXR4_9MICO
MTIDTLATLHCPGCDTDKAPADFPRNAARPSGIGSWCKRCQADAQADWRRRNPGYMREYNRARRAAGTKGDTRMTNAMLPPTPAAGFPELPDDDRGL